MNNLWIADGHCDSLGDLTSGKRDLLGEGEGHWDLAKARRAGLGLQFFAAYIESEYKPFLASWRGLEHLETALKFIDLNREAVFLIKGKNDLANLGKSKIGLVLNVEGGEILGESLFMLDLIYRLGVRSIGLTWNERNALADGVGEIGSKGGLSNFGLKVIARMNALGIIIDVSHLNEAGFWDVIAKTDKPIIASHSCARALCDHPRNLDNRQLRAIAEVGGLVGVNFCQDFLSETGQAGIDDVVKHICYIAEVAGVDCVGFGSDFDGIPSTPQGLEDASKLPLLLEKLRNCGFKEEDLTKISHGNFIRVLNNVLK
ncbi:MAG: dipeptidase [Desulfitobacteriia bacterium]|jgi:membrane dipeptidase